ncbi:hypothetical protein N657DRAFT_673807 [Parathielavia appendiculata]|uniref:Uncharacterized protein n=1 Tax=Parathielavia appendiculata TaxID=2587402 RepID=A0AAN6TUL1_9PEZI|nr:hypothetical protein N657DRAFT_673807 [Parathielavia appendiculata]
MALHLPSTGYTSLFVGYWLDQAERTIKQYSHHHYWREDPQIIKDSNVPKSISATSATNADGSRPTIRSASPASSTCNSSGTPPAPRDETYVRGLKTYQGSDGPPSSSPADPLDAKAGSVTAPTDVTHLPALRGGGGGTRRVAEACSPAYEPQSESKKLGPLWSVLGKNVLTLDQWLEMWEDDRMDAMQEEMPEYDDCDDWYDDDRVNSKDAAFGDEWDSYWET